MKIKFDKRKEANEKQEKQETSENRPNRGHGRDEAAARAEPWLLIGWSEAGNGQRASAWLLANVEEGIGFCCLCIRGLMFSGGATKAPLFCLVRVCACVTGVTATVSPQSAWDVWLCGSEALRCSTQAGFLQGFWDKPESREDDGHGADEQRPAKTSCPSPDRRQAGR